jgi:hypothetical protein
MAPVKVGAIFLFEIKLHNILPFFRKAIQEGAP